MKKVRILTGIAALAPAALVLAPGVAHAATRMVTCSAAPHHWTEFNDGGSITCWGYNGGTWNTGILLASKICGGNNYGFYSGSGPGGRVKDAKFQEGTTFAELPDTDGLNDALS